MVLLQGRLEQLEAAAMVHKIQSQPAKLISITSRKAPQLDILKEFVLGFVKIHILYHAGEEEGFCGVDMIKELRRHGYSIGPGTLYPMLHRMESGGYLTKAKSVKGGRMRIYYRITPKGKRALEGIKPKIDEVVSEVLT